MTDGPTAPADWYPDPYGRFTHRYWDGSAWTEHVARDGQPAVDPPHPETPAVAVETIIVEEEVETIVATEPGKHRGGTLARFGRRDPSEQGGSDLSEVARITRRSRRIKQTANVAPSLLQMLQQLQLEEPRYPLDEQIEVAGETYAVKGIKKAFREVGMPITEKGTTLEDVKITLVPEPWNPHDSNAVAVMVGPHHVGYVPADQAPEYSGPLGELASSGWLATGSARIWAKSDGGVVRARVTILVPEADVFES